MKKHGKIKSVPVKEVTEGMQVISNRHLLNELGSLGKVVKVLGDMVYIYSLNEKAEYMNYFADREKQIMFHYIKPIIELKTLVVEYELGYKDDVGHERINQISLKNSQWQKAVHNGEVDGDKIVEFQIVVEESSYEDDETIRPMTYRTVYAKIIPAKKAKKKMYSEEELLGFASYIENRRQYFKEKALIDNPEKMLEYWLEERGK